MESDLRRRRNAPVVLWTLILAKCFLLEYWVAEYAVPINSTMYVWGLSLFMASVATGVSFNLTRKERGPLDLSSPATRVWFGCAALVVLAMLGFWLGDAAALNRLLSVIAGILGFAYGGHYLYTRGSIFLYSAVGWLIASCLLFGEASQLALFYFSMSLILFSALSSLLVYSRPRLFKYLIFRE